MLNDRPVACQTREPTDPQGDRCPEGADEVCAQRRMRCHCEPVRRLVWQSVSSPAGAFRASGRECLLSPATKGTKSAAKTYGFGFPRRGANLFSLMAFPARPQNLPGFSPVKRTVPPQLAAWRCRAPLPVATVWLCALPRAQRALAPSVPAIARRAKPDVAILAPSGRGLSAKLTGGEKKPSP